MWNTFCAWDETGISCCAHDFYCSLVERPPLETATGFPRASKFQIRHFMSKLLMAVSCIGTFCDIVECTFNIFFALHCLAYAPALFYIPYHHQIRVKVSHNRFPTQASTSLYRDSSVCICCGILRSLAELQQNKMHVKPGTYGSTTTNSIESINCFRIHPGRTWWAVLAG